MSTRKPSAATAQMVHLIVFDTSRLWHKAVGQDFILRPIFNRPPAIFASLRALIESEEVLSKKTAASLRGRSSCLHNLATGRKRAVKSSVSVRNHQWTGLRAYG